MKISLFLALAVIILQSLYQPVNSADYGFEEICNEGDSWLYFATVAKRGDYATPNSVAQGFNAVGPGDCRSMLPYGTRIATIAFFKQDINGVFANVVIVPDSAKSSNEHIDMMCVRPQTAYREYGSRKNIVRKYTPPCDPGFLPAKTSFTFIDGSGDMTITIKHSNNRSLPPWGNGKVPIKRRPQLIWESEKNPRNKFVQEDIHAKRDREAAKILLKKAGEFIDKVKKEQAEKRARYYAKQMRIRAKQQKQLEKAMKDIEKPSDANCARYLTKKSYREIKNISLAGVKISMPVEEAHKAILCNGYTVDAAKIARSGGLKKYLQSTRPRVYQKQLSNGDTIIVEIENRVARSDASKKVKRNRYTNIDPRKYTVLTIRTRQKLSQPIKLKGDNWKDIKSNFKKTYRAGSKRHENKSRVQYQLKTKLKMVHLTLQGHVHHPTQEIYMIDMTMM